MKRILCAIWLLVLGMLAPPLAAQTGNGSALADAMARLGQYERQVGAMRGLVQQSLGPYQIHSECSQCVEHAWWGFGSCTRNGHIGWQQQIDFRDIRQQLDAVLARSASDGAALATRYAPTQAWIDALPAFSRAFDTQAEVVLGVQQAIRAGTGPNPAQRAQVSAALATLSSEMGRSALLLQAGVQALATSLQQQSTYRATLRQAISSADQNGLAALQSIEAAASHHPCQEGVGAQFAAIRTDFGRSSARINTAYQQLDGSSLQAEQGLGVLLGAVISAQTELNTIRGLLEASSNDQLGSFLERLHLNAAKQMWTELASASAQR